MASARGSYKSAAAGVTIPECPVCMETMSAPIFQCKTGHSLCNTCTSALIPPLCPICRQDMTQMRNWQLEELLGKVKIPCENKSFGCVYLVFQAEKEDHLKECIFRIIDCPLGKVFGKCSWSGKLSEIMAHFNDRHPTNCNITADEDIVLQNISTGEDERFVYLTNQGKMLFILTFKIDTLQKMAYWAIQHIGSKKSAQQHIYEIHVTSQQDNRRKVVFIDHCFNDAMKTDDVFKTGKCGMMPLNALEHFMKNKKLSFRYCIKNNKVARAAGPKNTSVPAAGPKNNNNDNNKTEGKNNRFQNREPKPKGPKKVNNKV